MGNPVFQKLPFFLEVPGVDGEGPDAPNVNALKAIRAQLGVAV